MKKRIITIAIVLIISFTALFIPIAGYSNGFESFQNRYVTVNGIVAKNESNILIPSTALAEFQLKNAGFTKITEWDYSILIYANTSSDLTYTADSVKYKFAAAGDLTAYFDIEKSKSSFTLNGCATLESILTKLHGGKQIKLNDTAPRYPFTLSIIDNASSEALSYYIGLAPIHITTIILNPSELIFGGIDTKPETPDGGTTTPDTKPETPDSDTPGTDTTPDGGTTTPDSDTPGTDTTPDGGTITPDGGTTTPDKPEVTTYRIYLEFLNGWYGYNFKAEYPEKAAAGELIEIKLHVEDYVEIGMCNFTYKVNDDYLTKYITNEERINNIHYLRFIMPADDIDVIIPYTSSVNQNYDN